MYDELNGTEELAFCAYVDDSYATPIPDESEVKVSAELASDKAKVEAECQKESVQSKVDIRFRQANKPTNNLWYPRIESCIVRDLCSLVKDKPNIDSAIACRVVDAFLYWKLSKRSLAHALCLARSSPFLGEDFEWLKSIIEDYSPSNLNRTVWAVICFDRANELVRQGLVRASLCPVFDERARYDYWVARLIYGLCLSESWDLYSNSLFQLGHVLSTYNLPPIAVINALKRDNLYDDISYLKGNIHVQIEKVYKVSTIEECKRLEGPNARAIVLFLLAVEGSM